MFPSILLDAGAQFLGAALFAGAAALVAAARTAWRRRSRAITGSGPGPRPVPGATPGPETPAESSE
ncbi:hypothetical protein QR77_25810 [Streptomyces sp. 150FB]|uniref:hypothetical protein n=1 Tax=Streptomyces sp. 150FB TaxID=1576605 RepID=UPI000589685F|nr:hypothetical protein [Streptomyces sp. 150FB]KIF76373.1 hypothetical protein QR77_25810 [Streptomyces sp. 150FB]